MPPKKKNPAAVALGRLGGAKGGLARAAKLTKKQFKDGPIACGNCEAIADRPYGSQYPYLAYIDYLTNVYTSNYNGLQATLTGRGYHGLSFLIGYTYSHALDDSSSL